MAEAAERIAIDISTTADVSGAQRTNAAVKDVGDTTQRAMAQAEVSTLRFNTALAVTNEEATLLSHSALIGFAELSRGIAKTAQAGEVGAFAMREFTGAAFRLSEFLGPGGEFLPIVGLVGFALYEAFKGGEDESEKMRKQFESDLAKMVDAVDQSGLQKKLRSLEIGDPSKGVGQGGGYKESIRDLVAQINDVVAEYNRLDTLIDEGTGKPVKDEDTWIGRATRVQMDAIKKHYTALEAELKPLREKQGELYDALLNPEVLPGMERDPNGLKAMKVTADLTNKLQDKLRDAINKATAAFEQHGPQDGSEALLRWWEGLWQRFALDGSTRKTAVDAMRKMMEQTLSDASKNTQDTATGGIAGALKGLQDLESKGPLLGTFSSSLGKGLSGLTNQSANLNEMLGTLGAKTVPALASGFQAMFAAVASHQNVFRAFAQVATGAIAEVAAKMAAEQFAEGLAMVADSIWHFLGPNPIAAVSAAKHFEAAAVFGSIAAGASIGAGLAGGGGGGSSGGGGGYSGGQFVPNNGQQNGVGGTTVIIQTIDPSSKAVINQMIYELNRSQMLGTPVIPPYGRPS